MSDQFAAVSLGMIKGVPIPMRINTAVLLLLACPSMLGAGDEIRLRAREQTVFHGSDGRLVRQLPVLQAGNTLRLCIEKGSQQRQRYLVIGAREIELLDAGPKECDGKRAHTTALTINGPKGEARIVEVVGTPQPPPHLVPGVDGVVAYRLDETILDTDFENEKENAQVELEKLAADSGRVYGGLPALVQRLGGEPLFMVDREPVLSAEALREYAKDLSTDQATLETLATALASVNATAPTDVMALTSRAIVLREIKGRSERLAEVLIKFQNAQGCPACRKRLYQGELLEGSSRQAVAFEADASFVGRVTSDHFRLRNLDHVMLYTLKPGDSQIQYEVKTEAKPAPVSVGRSLREMAPPGLVTEKGTCAVLAAAPPAWILERASEGAYYPGESVLSVTLQRVGKDLKREEVGTVSLQVAGAYRFSVNTGMYFSSVPTPRFLLDADRKVFREEGRSVAPGLFVTYYLVPRKYSVSRVFQRGYWIPSPAVGVRLDAPSKELLYGLSLEPVRGVQLIWGGMRAVRAEPASGVTLGASLPQPLPSPVPTVVPTIDKEQKGRFWALSFDLNLFAKKLIELIGF